MILDYLQRQHILMDDWYVARSDIADAIRETNQARNQRHWTVQNLKSQALELTIENARRRFTRTLRFQKSTHYQVQEMMKQAQLVESIRTKKLVGNMAGSVAA